ncbi:MAG TPA: hypothetical protein VF145_10040 [Chitinophagaceae bacterium]
MNKRLLFVLACILSSFFAKAQQVDSIYFNLYTDSLKKGALHFNYINVDGLLSDGRYIPLDTTQVRFTSSAGIMRGNVLQLDSTLKNEYVTITATLIARPAITKQVRIYIKKYIPGEMLKSEAELVEGWKKQKK